MIPPSSSFYDPSQAAAHQQPTQDYQAFINATYDQRPPTSQHQCHGHSPNQELHPPPEYSTPGNLYVPQPPSQFPHMFGDPAGAFQGGEGNVPYISRQHGVGHRGTTTRLSDSPASSRQALDSVQAQRRNLGMSLEWSQSGPMNAIGYPPPPSQSQSLTAQEYYGFYAPPFPEVPERTSPQAQFLHASAAPAPVTHGYTPPLSAGSTVYTPSEEYLNLPSSNSLSPGLSLSPDWPPSTHTNRPPGGQHSSREESGSGSTTGYPVPSPPSGGGLGVGANLDPVVPATAARVQARTKSTSPRSPTATTRGKRPAGRGGRAAGANKKRKSAIVPIAADKGDDGSSSSSEDEGPASGNGGGGRGASNSRLPGACTHCKKLKMKCDFPKNEDVCRRCQAGGHHCVVEGRKPRTAPNKREYLLAQIRQKDAIIESLLKQLHNPYLATPLSIASYRMATSPSDKNNQDVIAWLDRLQASVKSAGGKGGAAAFQLSARQENTNKPDSDDEDEATQVEEDAADEAGDEEGAGGGLALPDAAVPLGLIANLSLSSADDGKGAKSKGKAKTKRKGAKAAKTVREREENLDDDNVGVANATYFMPGPASNLNIRASLIEQHSPPEILVHGLVTPDDVEKLFDIFYKKINPFVSLLDPVLHTPSSTFARCPFLFTVICAISSRYYPEKSEIYAIAMHFAKSEAANALINGWKSVELCQAYLLMSYYGVPARRWEEDRSWLYAGLAIRLATDLNLHRTSTPNRPNMNDKQERELLNRTRTWMICFNLDRSIATQFGRPSTVRDDHITRNCQDWYKGSSLNYKYDIHVCAYTTLLRLVHEFHEAIYSDLDSPTGLNRRLDFDDITAQHDRKLTQFHEEWDRRFNAESDPDDPDCSIRAALLPFLVNYARLVMYSFAFQQAFERGIKPEDEVVFTKCFDSAAAVVRAMIESLCPSGYMRYAPDGYFVFAAFASAFLLKLLRPEFEVLLSTERQTQIFDLIARLIQIQSSPDIAIDDRHTPKLYARFLAGLLSKYRRDGATSGRLHFPHDPSQPGYVTMSAGYPIPPGSTSSSHVFSWAPPQGDYQGQGQGSGQGHTRTVPSAPPAPVYEQDATYTQGTGPIEVSGFVDMGDGMDGSMVGAYDDQEMLATMQAIKNPAWWDTMMMPGFTWSGDGNMVMTNGHGIANGHDDPHNFQMANGLMSANAPSINVRVG